MHDVIQKVGLTFLVASPNLFANLKGRQHCSGEIMLHLFFDLKARSGEVLVWTV